MHCGSVIRTRSAQTRHTSRNSCLVCSRACTYAQCVIGGTAPQQHDEENRNAYTGVQGTFETVRKQPMIRSSCACLRTSYRARLRVSIYSSPRFQYFMQSIHTDGRKDPTSTTPQTTQKYQKQEMLGHKGYQCIHTPSLTNRARSRLHTYQVHMYISTVVIRACQQEMST